MNTQAHRRTQALISLLGVATSASRSGRLAQLVRAPALQAGSRGFESLTAHH